MSFRSSIASKRRPIRDILHEARRGEVYGRFLDAIHADSDAALHCAGDVEAVKGWITTCHTIFNMAYDCYDPCTQQDPNRLRHLCRQLEPQLVEQGLCVDLAEANHEILRLTALVRRVTLEVHATDDQRAKVKSHHPPPGRQGDFSQLVRDLQEQGQMIAEQEKRSEDRFGALRICLQSGMIDQFWKHHEATMHLLDAGLTGSDTAHALYSELFESIGAVPELEPKIWENGDREDEDILEELELYELKDKAWNSWLLEQAEDKVLKLVQQMVEEKSVEPGKVSRLQAVKFAREATQRLDRFYADLTSIADEMMSGPAARKSFAKDFDHFQQVIEKTLIESIGPQTGRAQAR